MARRCIISGKSVLVGHNVSHANNKTKRRFLPNLQTIGLASEVLGVNVNLRIAVRAIRTIDRSGGLDAYLLSQSDAKLSVEARVLKRRIEKALSARSES